jgi:hypothetical protein
VSRGWPHRALITASGSQDASHTRATCVPVVVIIEAGRGRGPMKVLLVPLVAAFDAVLGIVSSDIERSLLVTARGGLPTSLC